MLSVFLVQAPESRDSIGLRAQVHRGLCLSSSTRGKAILGFVSNWPPPRCHTLFIPLFLQRAHQLVTMETVGGVTGFGSPSDNPSRKDHRLAQPEKVKVYTLHPESLSSSRLPLA